jgi:hypothetical protein
MVIVILLGNPIGRAVTLKPAVVEADVMLTVLLILDCGNEQDGLRTATSVTSEVVRDARL